MRGFAITKGSVGANVENLDGCSGLLLNGVAVVAAAGALGVTLGQTYLLRKPADAEALGITEAYDTANNVRVYRHISEFYRMAGEGTKLYICVCAQTKTPAQMIADHSHAMVAFADGEMRYLAIAYNPATGYTPTYVDGLENAIRESLAPAQALHDWSWNTDRPINVMIEARGINGAVVSMLNLKDIEVEGVLQKYPNVSLCIGQDWDYAEKLTGFARNMADVGTLLGSRAYLPVNRNVGEVETMDISDPARMIWVNAGLSDHRNIADAEADLSSLDEKGYIFGISYTGISGYRWNNDHVCAPEQVDEQGFVAESSISHGATLAKAARLLRTRMLPKVKTSVPVDTATGKLPPGIVKYFEGIGDRAFDAMLAAGEISGAKTTVDADSNLLSGDKALNVSFVVVPTGTINEIKGTINLKNSI